MKRGGRGRVVGCAKSGKILKERMSIRWRHIRRTLHRISEVGGEPSSRCGRCCHTGRRHAGCRWAGHERAAWAFEVFPIGCNSCCCHVVCEWASERLGHSAWPWHTYKGTWSVGCVGVSIGSNLLLFSPFCPSVLKPNLEKCRLSFNLL